MDIFERFPAVDWLTPRWAFIVSPENKNFHIYVHSRRDLIERSYDEEQGKKYYKVYFDEEE